MKEEKTKKIEKKEKKTEPEKINFSGKYVQAIGRRKTSVAQIRLYSKGKGNFFVNDLKVVEYFCPDGANIASQSLKESGLSKDYDCSVLVKGGGKKAQAEAIRHAVAKALVLIDENLKPVLKAQGWLTRDARKVERKKPGLRKARRAPQWSKR